MNKLLLIIPALFFSILGFSQGIEFEHGTWKEVLEKAQKTNKPIFIDVFTTWCGPCKQMSKNIFPLDSVGKVYNANFICYQIDAEKGEGIEIAKKYLVMAYPTYLYIKADGTIFYTAMGSMEAKAFVEVSKSALLEMNDPKPIAIWDKEYIDKKNDPAFLLDYIKKRTKLGVSNPLLFDEYLKLIPEEERTSATVIEMYRKEGPRMRVNSFAYTNLQKNSSKLFDKFGKNVTIFLLVGMGNTLNDATATKNEQLLATVISAYDQLPKGSFPLQKDEIYMQYYKKNGETDKYFKFAINYANNYLMNLNVDSLAYTDKAVLQSLETQIKSGALARLDPKKLAELKSITANFNMNKISQSLNNIAWDAFEKVTDKKVLKDALSWSKRSLEISPNKATYLDTYANLFYKLGQKEEAITNEKKALRNTDIKDTNGYKGMEETLRKMNAGEKTWK